MLPEIMKFNQHVLIFLEVMASILQSDITIRIHVHYTFCSFHASMTSKIFTKQINYLTAGMIFFRYLTDFSYFPLKQKFWHLQDTVKTSQNDLFERGCWWFQLLSLIFIYFKILTWIISATVTEMKNKSKLIVLLLYMCLKCKVG